MAVQDGKMSMKSLSEVEQPRFKTGDIIRYNDGPTSLFRFAGTFNAPFYYGEHVLGAVIGASDRKYYQLRLADEKDLELCREKQPKWFKNV